MTRVWVDSWCMGMPIELAAGCDMHSAHHERVLSDGERAQHLKAHRGADEPRRRQFDGRPDMFESEPLRHRGPQRPVVHAQHQRNIGSVWLGCESVTQHLAQHDPGLDIDHVVLGQHRYRAGLIDAGRFQRLAQRRVPEDDRHVEFGRRRQEAVVLVAFDDCDVAAGRREVTDHADTERTEPDDDDVVAQMTRTLRGPAEFSKRRVISSSARNATSTAVVITPANINKMLNNRSQVGWFMKLKSP